MPAYPQGHRPQHSTALVCTRVPAVLPSETVHPGHSMSSNCAIGSTARRQMRWHPWTAGISPPSPHACMPRHAARCCQSPGGLHALVWGQPRAAIMFRQHIGKARSSGGHAPRCGHRTWPSPPASTHPLVRNALGPQQPQPLRAPLAFWHQPGSLAGHNHPTPKMRGTCRDLALSSSCFLITGSVAHSFFFACSVLKCLSIDSLVALPPAGVWHIVFGGP